MAFIQTDGGFIAGHNEVFTPGVVAYLAAIVAEARFKRAHATNTSTAGDLPAGCVAAAGWFNFGGCFQTYEALFSASQ